MTAREFEAFLGFLLATPVATWWLVGDQSSHNPADPFGPDYLIAPPHLSQATKFVLGISAVATMGVCLIALLRSASQTHTMTNWLVVLFLAGFTGVVIGVGLRVLTAGVAGANIGGGSSFSLVVR